MIIGGELMVQPEVRKMHGLLGSSAVAEMR